MSARNLKLPQKKCTKRSFGDNSGYFYSGLEITNKTHEISVAEGVQSRPSNASKLKTFRSRRNTSYSKQPYKVLILIGKRMRNRILIH